MTHPVDISMRFRERSGFIDSIDALFSSFLFSHFFHFFIFSLELQKVNVLGTQICSSSSVLMTPVSTQICCYKNPTKLLCARARVMKCQRVISQNHLFYYSKRHLFLCVRLYTKRLLTRVYLINISLYDKLSDPKLLKTQHVTGFRL